MNLLAPPETSTSLVDFITARVKDMILLGELGPDEPVNINVIAKQAQVSLVPVREALARLSAIGLLQFAPNRGYRVIARLGPEARAALYEAREILERSAAPLAAANRTDAQVAELRSLNLEMHALGEAADTEPHAFFRLNDRFHKTYVGMTGNLYLERMFEGLSFDLLMAREHDFPTQHIARLADEHDEIIAAIEQRDADGLATLLTKHIRSTR